MTVYCAAEPRLCLAEPRYIVVNFIWIKIVSWLDNRKEYNKQYFAHYYKTYCKVTDEEKAKKRAAYREHYANTGIMDRSLLK